MRTTSRLAAAVLICSSFASAAPLTDDQLAGVAQEMAKSINTGDAGLYTALWDADAFIDLVTTRVSAGEEFKRGFVDGVKQTMMTQLSTTLIQASGQTGGMRYLGLRKTEDGTRPVIRVIGTNGLNYHELIIKPDAAGKPKVVDVMIYASGETLTQTVRRMYIQGALQQGKGGPALPPGFETLQTMQKQMRDQDFAGALATYDAAPAEGKKQKIVQMMRVMAASKGTDMDLYQAALDEYVKTFKGDSTADLISLDSLFLKQKYAECLAALDRLDKQVGGDPYLNVYRANVATAQGDVAKAKTLAAAALVKEPTLFEAADVLLTAALTEKDYPAVKKYLLHIEANAPKFRFGDLKGAEGFEGFVASPQYAQWVKERKAE